MKNEESYGFVNAPNPYVLYGCVFSTHLNIEPVLVKHIPTKLHWKADMIFKYDLLTGEVSIIKNRWTFHDSLEKYVDWLEVSGQ